MEQWFDILKAGGASLMQGQQTASQEIINNPNLKWLKRLDSIIGDLYKKSKMERGSGSSGKGGRISISVTQEGGFPAMGGFNAVTFKPELQHEGGTKGTVLINRHIFNKYGGADYFFEALKQHFTNRGDMVENIPQADKHGITLELVEAAPHNKTVEEFSGHKPRGRNKEVRAKNLAYDEFDIGPDEWRN